ncbi:MAG: hypothetical protein ABFS42_09830 [Candidatus Krumholzibacteriota bacterium]
MRKLLALLFVAGLFTLVVPSAHAIVDPDPDGIGVYFDLNADITEIMVPAAVPFYAYAILTNPTGGDIWGYEFSRIFSVPPGMEGMLYMLERIWHGVNDGITPVEPPDLGGNVMAGISPPLPVAPTVILVTWQFMLLTPMVVDCYVGPSTGDFGTTGRLVYETATGPVPMHVSSGDPALKVATVNGTGVVAVETTTFGALKALYR